ncbi:hypothetical protein [Streptomyces sp. NPDC051657]|uniref:hypothetical protein n=1 Tax=unclassified Streptomyces TaxID=2593676 RepID=UPI0034241EF6
MPAKTPPWPLLLLSRSARMGFVLDCMASSYVAMFGPPSENPPSPSPQASSSESSSASPSSRSSRPSAPDGLTPSERARLPRNHQCRDCTNLGGIGFDCNHMVRGVRLADECRWCRDKGFRYGEVIP